MDGVWLVNVVVGFGCVLFDLLWGVDVFSFGGIKNGVLVVEVVVFFDFVYVKGFDYCCK